KHGFYSDLFWTPLIAQALAIERKKDSEMVRALFSAVEMHSGRGVTLSQLGSDYKVSQLKKDNMWKSVRLLDILEAYEDIFELVPDGSSGGWQVT
ncbi:slc43a2, partial [Symbiodinium pilosum]